MGGWMTVCKSRFKDCLLQKNSMPGPGFEPLTYQSPSCYEDHLTTYIVMIKAKNRQQPTQNTDLKCLFCNLFQFIKKAHSGTFEE